MNKLKLMLCTTDVTRYSSDVTINNVEHTLSVKKTIFSWTQDGTHTGIKPYHGSTESIVCLKAEPIQSPPWD